MKNIILQHFNGTLGELENLSVANIQQYAKFVEADYRLITGKPFNVNLTDPCQKMHMLHKEFDDYDTVLMLDIDMFTPRGNTDNVFEEVGVGLFEPFQENLRRKFIDQYPALGSIHAPYWGGAIYKLSKDLRLKLREQMDGRDNSWMQHSLVQFNKRFYFEDEGIIHTLAQMAQISSVNAAINPKWCQNSYSPTLQKSGLIHIRKGTGVPGFERTKIENYNILVQKGMI